MWRNLEVMGRVERSIRNNLLGCGFRTSRRLFGLLSVVMMGFVIGCGRQDGIGDFKFMGYIKAKSSEEIKNSPWGIQFGTTDPALLDRAAQIGIKWTRLSASWPSIEKEKGKYDWSSTDMLYSGSLKRGITPFVCINRGNELYSKPVASADRPPELYGAGAPPPTSSNQAMKAWLAFVKALVERYHDQIKYWEIWNEPNHSGYWRPKPDAKAYGRLLKETAKLIKQIDPGAVIIGGATAGIATGIDIQFIEGFLSMDTAQLIDIISFHRYSEYPETRIYEVVELWDLMNTYNPKLKLWQGECGYPSHSSTTGSRLQSPWGLNIQAKWLLRQSLTDYYFCRVELSNYFYLVSRGNRQAKQERPTLSAVDSILGFPERGGARVRGVGVNEKCILTNPDHQPKPAYFAYQNICALIDKRYELIKTKANVKVIDQGVFYGLEYGDDVFPSVPLVASFKSREGSFLLAYWLPWSMQEDLARLAKIDLTVEDVLFEEPVLVDLLTGKVYKITVMSQEGSTVALSGLPLADYPFAVVEKNEIEIIQKRLFD